MSRDSGLRRRAAELFSLPDWWREVDAGTLRKDAVAGLSVAVMLVPQAMAYATLAGLPPIYGLYASLVPLLAYPIFGSARQLAVGIVALDMLILGAGLMRVAEPGTGRFVALAILTAACVGLIQLAMGALRLGFLADLLSRPVITGFTAAAALVIAAGQIGPLLGMALPRSEFLHEIVGAALTSGVELHPPTAILGGASVLVILGMRRWNPALPSALVVVALAGLVTWAGDLGARGVAVTGEVPRGLPTPNFEAFRIGDVMTVLPVAATLALIQLMSAISIGRTLSARHRYTVRPNRELLGLGTANLLGSIFRGVPVSASFSRSAINDDCGARTPLSNVFAAAVVALALLFLTPLFIWLPTAALAAIIVVSALGLIRPSDFVQLAKVHRRDGALALLTAGATLAFGIQEGIVVGVVASTLMVLARLSRPNIAELGLVPGTSIWRDRSRFESAEPVEGVLVVRVDAAFSFFNAAYFRDRVLRRYDDDGESGTGDRPRIGAVVLEARGINDVDTTALDALRELVGTLRAREVELHLAGLKGEVRDVLQRSEISDELDPRIFHLSTHHAVESILARWDAGDEGDRLASYRERTGGDAALGEGGPLT